MIDYAHIAQTLYDEGYGDVKEAAIRKWKHRHNWDASRALGAMGTVEEIAHSFEDASIALRAVATLGAKRLARYIDQAPIESVQDAAVLGEIVSQALETATALEGSALARMSEDGRRADTAKYVASKPASIDEVLEGFLKGRGPSV
jgi:hypothetical protein